MEKTVLSHLIFNEKYGRKVLPYIKSEYFQDKAQKALFELIENYVKKYNSFPTKETLFIDLSNLLLDDEDFKGIQTLISQLDYDPTTKLEWLVDQTEIFCQDRALNNAIYEAIKVYDGRSKITRGGLPKLLQDALQVSFDNHIGHDFIEDAESRFESYTRVEDRPCTFDIDYINRITNGGFPRKTFNCLLAPTGGGKSLAMCHFAAHNMICGQNVLYITLEMAEERIAQRIDANLLNVPIQEIASLSKDEYEKKMERVRKNTKGKLIVKEYPTASAGAGHFRHLLNELRIKKNFIPDVVYIDYINLCVSSRIKNGAQVNSYSYVKAIAEELRGLAVEFNLVMITATQANRSSYGSSDIDLDNTSDSIGLPMTVDFMLAMITTEELEATHHIMFKQLKNRFGDINRCKRFIVGIDRSKMRLYNAEQSAQEDIMDGPEEDEPVFNKSPFGSEDEERSKKGRRFDNSKFKGFK